MPDKKQRDTVVSKNFDASTFYYHLLDMKKLSARSGWLLLHSRIQNIQRRLWGFEGGHFLKKTCCQCSFLESGEALWLLESRNHSRCATLGCFEVRRLAAFTPRVLHSLSWTPASGQQVPGMRSTWRSQACWEDLLGSLLLIPAQTHDHPSILKESSWTFSCWQTEKNKDHAPRVSV